MEAEKSHDLFLPGDTGKPVQVQRYENQPSDGISCSPRAGKYEMRRLSSAGSSKKKPCGCTSRTSQGKL